MVDKIDKKVIDLFSSHRKTKTCHSGNVCQTNEGYFYVTTETDDNGRNFKEEDLLKRAENFYYIVKVMITEKKHPYINSYKIPGDELLDFISLYNEDDSDGKIIEIDKFFAEDWA